MELKSSSPLTTNHCSICSIHHDVLRHDSGCSSHHVHRWHSSWDSVYPPIVQNPIYKGRMTIPTYIILCSLTMVQMMFPLWEVNIFNLYKNIACPGGLLVPPHQLVPFGGECLLSLVWNPRAVLWSTITARCFERVVLNSQ